MKSYDSRSDEELVAAFEAGDPTAGPEIGRRLKNEIAVYLEAVAIARRSA